MLFLFKTVKRKRSTGSRALLHPVSLMLTNNKGKETVKHMFLSIQKRFLRLVLNLFVCFPEMGIRVDSTNHISCIVPGSVAADEGTIAVGDKIITVSE